MPADPSFLAEIPLFATLDEDERNVLASQTAARTLTSGETLFRAGQPGDALFIVSQGAVELFATDTSGNKILFHTATRGEYFGELSLIDGGPRTANAVATEETELVAVDRE